MTAQTTDELRENLRRLRSILSVAAPGPVSTAELERGIARHELEIDRRERLKEGK